MSIGKVNLNNMEEFIEKFASLFPVTPKDEISADTEFKYLEDWSSMTTLTIVAMVEDDYGITLSSSDIRNADTVSELYELIVQQ